MHSSPDRTPGLQQKALARLGWAVSFLGKKRQPPKSGWVWHAMVPLNSSLRVVVDRDGPLRADFDAGTAEVVFHVLPSCCR